MDIKTFEDLIEWSRELHQHLGRCMKASVDAQPDDRAKELLIYLADHEQAMEKMVIEFERQANDKALKTRVYDYLANGPVKSHRTCTVPYDKLDYEGICREVFDYHSQLMDLYKSLIGKAETANARYLMEDLLEMEKHESMRLAQQIDAGRAL
jgi:hypothetical protein